MSRSRPRYHNVHIFYYPWYANPKFDGAWNHWNHKILPHWNDAVKSQYVHSKNYSPPEDIGSSFYPMRGPYSSRDPNILEEHMQELKDFVVVVSWWGREKTDGEGMATDPLIPLILAAAEKFGAQIAFHIEPYPGRTAISVREDIQYIVDKYGSSASFYRDEVNNNRPVMYLYDSYLIPATEWATIFDPKAPKTIRNTKYDVVALGLYVNQADKNTIPRAHFDGCYTYFAAEGFTEGSTSSQWKNLVHWARSVNLTVSLSVGPGYDDVRIRPWNAINQRPRLEGRYYDDKWVKAIEAQPHYVSVTSYNEWMEGTQIEAAVPKSIPKTIFDDKPYTYNDYAPLSPNYYVDKTIEWASKLIATSTNKHR
jgi:glycoprotein endo-alpha-1,2-mannosidase